jgi:hypothetical protein
MNTLFNQIKLIMSRNWKTALAAMGIVPKNGKPNMVLEIQGANGENLVFPDVNDITEIEVGTTVTAEDGEHVFTADNNTYSIVVVAGIVTELEVEPIEAPAPPAPEPDPNAPTNVLTPETIEMLQAFADQFEASATAIAALQAQNADLVQTIADLKGLMSHDDDKPKPTAEVVIGGKKIDLTKINLK